MEAFESLTQYYSQYDEDGRLVSKHGQVEYLTTMKYIDAYLTSGMKILEVGAGTGRYSHALAQRGYELHAVELIQHNIDLLNAKTLPHENIRVTQGNAMDLSLYADNTFDLTLVLGPMYHLFTIDDQKKALSEALRVTKQGGILFVAYCISDASILGYGFKDGHIFELIHKGLLNTDTFKAYSTPEEVFQLYRKDDIDELMSSTCSTRLHYVATDLATNYMRDTVDAMDDTMFSMYLRYHFSVCERPDLVGATHHSLDIVKKN